MPNPDGTMTLQERWAADDELAGQARAEGESLLTPTKPPMWRQDVDGEGDLSAGYGPGAPMPQQPDNR